MTPHLLRALLLGLCCLAAGLARADDCPTPAALAPVLQTDGLFLGELHGSVEVPALVDCLARALSAELAGRRRVTVALEVPPDALDEAHPFWRGQDGRSSQAMMALLQSLKALQAQGRIELIGFQPTIYYPAQADYEAAMARLLDATPSHHFLLALAGNFHAAGPDADSPTARTLQPAGALMKRPMAHVLVVNREPSASWHCVGDLCAAHPIRPATLASGQSPGLHPLRQGGYDGIFVLERLSASPPLSPAPLPGQAP
jgi:hypothetical protein